MAEATGPIPLLTVLSRKLEEFLNEVDNNHLVWLREIEEEAKRMFTSGFSEEPELMPKTPSQKNRRKKKRVSAIRDENQDPNKRRLSRRRSSARHSTVKSSSLKFEAEKPVLEEETVEARPKRMTRAAAAARAISTNCYEQEKEEFATVPIEGRIPLVEIREEDRRSAKLFEKGIAYQKIDPSEEIGRISESKQSPKKTEQRKDAVDTLILLVPETPQSAENVAGRDRSASKLKIAHSFTPKTSVAEVCVKEGKPVNTVELAVNHNSITVVPIISDTEEKDLTPKGSKANRKSLRRSLIVQQSKGHRSSLVERYSLASKRESMTRDAIRKSMRRSFSKKSQQSSSSSSHVSREPSLETTKEEIEEEIAEETSPNILSEITDLVEQVSKSPRHSLRHHSASKIADSIPAAEREGINSSKGSPDHITKQNSPNKENNTVQSSATEESLSARRKQSYKRAVNEIYESPTDEEKRLDEDCSPPRKKTPSPPCPSSKILRPNLKTFLHTVQKNQLLMTPVSAGRGVVKSFIKRNTPVKIDAKEKEKQRLEMLKKKEEAEMLRKQKLEEEKKRRMEEARLKREERMRKVLQARERVEKIEEEKKKKIENKFAQIDEKSEKIREERLAEEKAKKKVAAKKMEEVETRRRQEEESRKQKLLQLEEEERKHQEMLQRKKEDEELEKQRKMAEAKKQAELRQAEIERERLREQQLAAEKEIERKKELERIKAEKERERQEKEKALQLQRELERSAREEAAAREKERLRKEMEERERKKLEEQRQATLERQRQEKLRLENERKLQESLEKKEQQAKSGSNKDALNVTMDVPAPSVCQSYQMTPKGCDPKPPKINPNNYGMDLNSDDSTDDEGAPRKPIPSWAEGKFLMQAINRQYYNPPDHQSYFGEVENPKLEEIFYKSKPRYNKRTSSAVWNSPPSLGNRDNFAYTLKKF